MSESLSQSEIEDVLSSIRRLVSQEVARTSSERLILTPALRVVGDESVRPNSESRPERESERRATQDLHTLVQRVSTAASASEDMTGVASGGALPAGPGDGRGDSGEALQGNTQHSQQRPGMDGDSPLREMVTEVLRDELRGPLGERMTRSIRKLVRAEVARALSERSHQ